MTRVSAKKSSSPPKEDPLEPESQRVKRQRADAFKQGLLGRFDPINLGDAGSRLAEHVRTSSQKLTQDQKTAEEQKVCYKTALGTDSCRNDVLSQKLVRAVEITEKHIFKAAMPPMRVAGKALDWVGEAVHNQVSAACHADRYTEAVCRKGADVAVAGVHFLRDHTPVGPAVRGYKKYRDEDFPKFMEEVGVSKKDASQFISDVTNVGVTVLLMGPSSGASVATKAVPRALKTIHPEALLSLPSYAIASKAAPAAVKAAGTKAPLLLPCYAIVPKAATATVKAIRAKALLSLPRYAIVPAAPKVLPAVAKAAKAIAPISQAPKALPTAAGAATAQTIEQFFQPSAPLSSSTSLPLEFRIIPREPIAQRGAMYHLTKKVMLSVEMALLNNGASVAFLEGIENLTKRRGHTLQTIEKIKAWALGKGANRLVLEAEFPENKRYFQFFLDRFQYLGSQQTNHLGQGSTDPQYAMHQFEIPLHSSIAPLVAQKFSPARKLSAEILKIHKAARFSKTNKLAYDALDQSESRLVPYLPIYAENSIFKNEEAIWRDAILQQTGEPALGNGLCLKKDQRNIVARIGNFLIKDSKSPLEIFNEISGMELIRSLHLERSITGQLLAVGRYGNRTFMVRTILEGPTLTQEFKGLGKMDFSSPFKTSFLASLLKKIHLMGVAVAEFQQTGLSFQAADPSASTRVVNDIERHVKKLSPLLKEEERARWIPSQQRIDEIIQNFTRRDSGALTFGFLDVHPGQFVFPGKALGIIDTAFFTEAMTVGREPRASVFRELFRFSNQFTVHAREEGVTLPEARQCEITFFNAWRSQLKDPQTLAPTQEIFKLYSDLLFLHDVHTHYKDSWPAHLGDRHQYIEANLFHYTQVD